MSAHDLGPAYVALYDQIAATRRDQLGDLAALARAHILFTDCTEAACPAPAVGDEIGRATCRDRDELLYFAIGELARLAYGTGGGVYARP